MRRPARFLWRLIPTGLRHRLFQRTVKSKNPFVRAALRLAATLTLRHHRFTVSYLWPEMRGLDYLALLLWSVFLRFHTLALGIMWRRGHLARRWLRPRRSEPANQTVVHATSSFDLGGTQTQIKHLCTAAGARYRHDATEIFPELNFLYRRDVTVDPARYVQGRLWRRTVGRLVVNRNYRSSQLIQIYKLMCDFRLARPDVVVGWGHELCVTTFIAAALARVPHIVFCIRTVNPTYGWVAPPFPDLLRNAHRHMLPNVSQVVVNSTLLQRDHAAWVGMPPEAITVCPNGVSVAALTPERAAAARRELRAAYGIADDVIVILNVGRFSNEKGQWSMVEANRLLRRNGSLPPFCIVLCGDGVTLDPVKAAAEAEGMRNMIFPGRTDRVREWLSAADIFVMPSDFEGMPNAMMEAMAAGLPCVSTDRSGALDVARPDREALYYGPRDAAQLAVHLERLLRNPGEAAALGRAAAARITEFSVSRFVRDFETVLDRARAAAPVN
ncbi:MAG TPA: glycosyltransferase [Vicinamibacterales bacterium]|nr:glycosyltransferase [Vicinamibacterales bacterium]